MAEAVYMQIAKDLLAKIKSGELAAGAMLPPEPVLQDQYSKRPEFSSTKVSRNTVRDAIEVLVREGQVEKRPGQGTFVTEKIEPFMTTLSGDPDGGESTAYQSEVTRRGRTPEESIPRVEIHKASKAPELRLGEGKLVISRHQRRFIDRKPYSLQTSFYPMSYADKAPLLIAATEIKAGAVAYIQESLNIKQVGWRDVLQARIADSTETEFLGLSAKSGAQILEARRTAFDSGGNPIRLTVTVYVADRNRIAYEAGAVPEVAVPIPADPGDLS